MRQYIKEVILVLLVLNLALTFADYIKPLNATVFQGMFQAIGEMSGQNLQMRQYIIELEKALKEEREKKK